MDQRYLARAEAVTDAETSDDEEPLVPGRPPRPGVVCRVPGRTAGPTASPIQLRVTGAPRGDDPVAAARGGLRGAAAPLPYLDRIRASFGPDHELGGVRAQVGGDAAAACDSLGAAAYAHDGAVAFAHAPDLHTAAHEAAHVVQQRAGVQLGSAVGEAGDAYERHADLVADCVVRGESVAHLLGTTSATGGGTPVQRRIVLDKTTTLSGKSLADVVDAFVAEHARDNPAGAAYLRNLIDDNEDHPLADVLRDMPRGKATGESSAEPGVTRQQLTEVLGKLLSSGEYVFNNPPLDSSGDIYHTVGLLAILREAGLPLPRIKIGYHPPADRSSKTYVNASRAVEFAAAIGFGDQVSAIAVEVGTSSKLNTKLLNTRMAIAAEDDRAKHKHDPILDQKSSTAVIAMVMQAFGREAITEIIRKHMTTYRDDVPPETQVASNQWQEAQLARIRAVANPDKKLMLFNERIADNQDQHNSEGPEFTAIRDKVKELGIAHYTLRSHGGPAAKGDEDQSSPAFDGAGADGKTWGAKGFNTKVQHLQLLTRIKSEFGERLIGIYGSTSGTLDAPALIGIPTLSLHSFSIDCKVKSGRINDQDQRELIMAPFKSVVRRNEEDDGEQISEVLEQWMSGEYTGPEFDKKDIGGLGLVYSTAKQGTSKPDDNAFKETTAKLPEKLSSVLQSLFDPMVGGLSEALAAAPTGNGPIALDPGSASGVGMNCLIHTMVQLAANAAQAAGAQVAAIRKAMIDTHTAKGDEMIDPYADGAGAALMEQFRSDGQFATQILQWTGGRLQVHPMIGNGPVRLLLHTGNHFVPLWGNNGVAITPTQGIGASDATGGELDRELQMAIYNSLHGGSSTASDAPEQSSSPTQTGSIATSQPPRSQTTPMALEPRHDDGMASVSAERIIRYLTWRDREVMDLSLAQVGILLGPFGWAQNGMPVTEQVVADHLRHDLSVDLAELLRVEQTQFS